MSVEIAMSKLNLKQNELSYFEVEDIFNVGNTISGYLSRKSDHRYGALVITKVNGIDTKPQIIYATPKLHYPFGKNQNGDRIYNFPKFVKVHVYEKLDGTNILNYSYVDAHGKRFSTFKTRLVPILRESSFGDFAGMWKEMLDKYPNLRAPEYVMSGKYTLSYELFGYRNPHLIEYTVSLDTRLLFGIRQEDGHVIIPDHFTQLQEVLLGTSKKCDNSTDLVSFYNDCRDEVFKNNVKKEDGVIQGSEGYIFYVFTEELTWKQVKCKSEDIEAIHWSASEGLPMCVILPTVWNALESCDSLTVVYVIELLKEEYDISLINRAYTRIEKAIALVLAKAAFRKKVKEEYLNCNYTFDVDGKQCVMRALSKNFDKKIMQKVYTALRELNIIRE